MSADHQETPWGERHVLFFLRITKSGANNQTSMFPVSLVPQELQDKMSPRANFPHVG